MLIWEIERGRFHEISKGYAIKEVSLRKLKLLFEEYGKTEFAKI